MSFTTENKILIIHSKCNWYGCVHLNLQMPWDNNSERCEYPQLQDLLRWRFFKRTSTCTWEHTDIWTNNFQLVGLSPGSPCCSWTSLVSMSWRMLEGDGGREESDRCMRAESLQKPLFCRVPDALNCFSNHFSEYFTLLCQYFLRRYTILDEFLD